MKKIISFDLLGIKPSPEALKEIKRLCFCYNERKHCITVEDAECDNIREIWRLLGFKYPLFLILSKDDDEAVVMNVVKQLSAADRDEVRLNYSESNKLLFLHIADERKDLKKLFWNAIFEKKKEQPNELNKGSRLKAIPSGYAAVASRELFDLLTTRTLAHAVVIDDIVYVPSHILDTIKARKTQAIEKKITRKNNTHER